jgi:hypothetical protein
MNIEALSLTPCFSKVQRSPVDHPTVFNSFHLDLRLPNLQPSTFNLQPLLCFGALSYQTGNP